MSIDPTAPVQQPTSMQGLLRPEAAIQALGLRVGQEVQAKVMAMLSETIARMSLPGNMEIATETPVALPKGAVLTFQVQRDGAGGLQLATTEKALQQAIASAPMDRTVPAPAAGKPAPNAAPYSALPQQPPQNAEALLPQRSQNMPVAQLVLAQQSAEAPQPVPASPDARQTLAMQLAHNGAVPRPMADSVRSLQNPMIQSQVLAQSQPPAQGRPAQAYASQAAAVVARVAALAGSQPLQEQMVGQHDGSGLQNSHHQALLSASRQELTRSPAKMMQDAVAQAIRQAAPQQDSLAPLFANLSALSTLPASVTAAVPKPVMDAAMNLLGLRFSPEAGGSAALASAGADPSSQAGHAAMKLQSSSQIAQQLAKGVSASGVFMESHLAEPGSMVVTPQTDMKAALLALKAALRDAHASAGAGAQAEPLAGREALAQRHMTSSVHEPPPLKTAFPHGQAPVQADISAQMPKEVLLSRLETQADAALSRLTMMQAASLPEASDGALKVQAGSQQHVMLAEVPIRFGAQTAIAQLRIEREDDGEARAKGVPENPSFNMQFSLDVSPMGPVHALVNLRAGHVGVNIWAEDEATADRFTAHLDELRHALEGSAFTVEAIHCSHGKPKDPRPAFTASRFGALLDRTS